MTHAHPLELSPEAMRALVAEAMSRIVPHVASLPEQPAADTEGAVELARTLVEHEPPEAGVPAGPLLDHLFWHVVPKSFNAAGPGYLAYIPGGGLFPSAVADLVSGSFNRYVGVFAAAPGLAQLEANVVRWFCRIVGYGRGSGGFLTSGGSLAAFSAIVAARRKLLPESFLGGVLYASDQAHHSIAKAAFLAGFPARNVRAIPCDGDFRIRLDLLEEEIARDRAAGRTPFFVVGNAGSTNTGAVDPLPALADLARREGMWLHVDGAYGGFFAMTSRGRLTLAGIERADSVVLDPHKGLFLPYGTGSLLVKDRRDLAAAHALHAHYLPDMQEDEDLVDFCELSPELSRPFRGLRVWLPFKLFGLDAFRRCLDEKLDLALEAERALRAIPDLEIVAPPQLSLLAFRVSRPGLDADERDALNRRVRNAVNARGRVHVSGALLDTPHAKGFVLRFCVLNFRTHAPRMAMAIEDVRAAVAECLAPAPAGSTGT